MAGSDLNCFPCSRISRRQDTKIVLREHYRRFGVNCVDLVLILAPLRIVNAIDPLLGFDHYTSILGHVRSGPVGRMLLALLDRNGPVERVARVNLQTLLVGSDVELDASDIRGHGQDAQVGRFWCRVARAIKDESIVIACTIEAAAIDRLLNISAYLLRRCEIQISIIDDADGAIGHLNIIEFDIASSVGHI